MDYSVCLLLLLSTISSVSPGPFPTAQMWVELPAFPKKKKKNSLLASPKKVLDHVLCGRNDIHCVFLIVWGVKIHLKYCPWHKRHIKCLLLRFTSSLKCKSHLVEHYPPCASAGAAKWWWTHIAPDTTLPCETWSLKLAAVWHGGFLLSHESSLEGGLRSEGWLWVRGVAKLFFCCFVFFVLQHLHMHMLDVRP